MSRATLELDESGSIAFRPEIFVHCHCEKGEPVDAVPAAQGFHPLKRNIIKAQHGLVGLFVFLRWDQSRRGSEFGPLEAIYEHNILVASF